MCQYVSDPAWMVMFLLDNLGHPIPIRSHRLLGGRVRLRDMPNERFSLATFNIIQFSASPAHMQFTHMRAQSIDLHISRNDSLGGSVLQR